MAYKITAIVLDETLDEADLESIVRRALLDAGVSVDSVEGVGLPQDAVLYMFEGDRRRYVEAIPTKSSVVWTDDIDRAKVCHGPASIRDCRRMVKDRLNIEAKVQYV